MNEFLDKQKHILASIIIGVVFWFVGEAVLAIGLYILVLTILLSVFLTVIAYYRMLNSSEINAHADASKIKRGFLLLIPLFILAVIFEWVY